MRQIATTVGARGGKIYIPRAVNALVYESIDPKRHVVDLNAHIHLAKACLCHVFITETYFIKSGDRFIEQGLESTGFSCVLTHEGVEVQKRAVRGPVPQGVQSPCWRPIYMRIKPDADFRPPIPNESYVQIRNVQSLANAFASLYALKTADEIMSFARSLNKRLN